MRQARQPSTPMLVFASCTLYLITSSNTRNVHQYTFTFLLSPFFSLRSLWESSTNVGPRPKGCSLVQQMKENPSPSKRGHALCDALFPVIHQQHSDMDTNPHSCPLPGLWTPALMGHRIDSVIQPHLPLPGGFSCLLFLATPGLGKRWK